MEEIVIEASVNSLYPVKAVGRGELQKRERYT